jgi:hypothetical protein
MDTSDARMEQETPGGCLSPLEVVREMRIVGWDRWVNDR